MPEKKNTPPIQVSFEHRIYGKSLKELEESSNYRQTLLKNKNFTSIKEKDVRSDLGKLSARQTELARLLGKTNIEEIVASIDIRKGLVKRIGDDPTRQWEKKGREVELSVLSQAREREMFVLRVNAKSPKDLTESSNRREKILRDAKENTDVIAQTKYGLEVIRKRQAEILRHQSKSNPAEISASIKLRERMIQDIKGDNDIAKLKRAKLQVEIDVLKNVQEKYSPVRSPASAKRILAPSSSSPKEVQESKPEIKSSKDKIGHHGVIITKLIEDGVVIDGTRIRQGLDVQRSVSEKSSKQYTDDFRNLFLANLSALESNLQPAAREKLLDVKQKRLPILKLLAIAYMPENPEIKKYLQHSCGFNGESFESVAKPALAYFRHLIEDKIGNAVEEQDVVRKFGNPVAMEQNLRKILDLLKKDSKNLTNFQTIIQNGITSSGNNSIEARDTLQLGLLIRQFVENAKARKEHRIDELVTRFL